MKTITLDDIMKERQDRINGVAKKKSKTQFEKLAERVKNELGLELHSMRRTHAGRNMKASGAFTWLAKIRDQTNEIGSATPVTEILEAKSLHYEYCRWNGAWELKTEVE